MDGEAAGLERQVKGKARRFASSIRGTFLCYQIPGEMTIDGKPIAGGTDIDASDFKFAGSIYPQGKPSKPAPKKAVKKASARKPGPKRKNGTGGSEIRHPVLVPVK